MQANPIRMQNLNLDGRKPASIVNQLGGLNATPTGAVSTAVLRFNTPAVVVGTGMAEVTTAAEGSIVTISEPGYFMLKFGGATNSGATNLGVGVGINMGAGPHVADPAYATPGVIWAVDGIRTDLSSTGFTFNFALTVLKSETAVIRFLATDSAGGAPVLNAGNAPLAYFYSITRRQAARGRS